MRPVMTSDVGRKDGVRTPKVFSITPNINFNSPKVILIIPRVMQKLFLLFCDMPFNSYL